VADPRFYSVAGPFNLKKLARTAIAELQSNYAGIPKQYSDVAVLRDATSEHVSFINNRKYIKDFENSSAGVIIVPPDLVEKAPRSASLLISKNPYNSYARIARAYYPSLLTPPKSKSNGLISPNSKIEETVCLDVGVVVKDVVEIGENTFVGANIIIERGVSIGANSWIASNVTLAYCLIGERVTIHTGVKIGQDGFGFAPGSPFHDKVPQLGRVIIDNDVEIGANTCIDRGALLDTEIGEGSKLDNLVQIGHNVKIGKGCLITGQVGIAGSTDVEDYVMVGGQAGIAGHLKIGVGAKIAAQSGVIKDVPPGKSVIGFPALNARQFWKNITKLKKIAERKEE
jgi:UDP-3-O-[3-hydroxymyristoyl] glucosamine N-acyltransferase